ncbi:MAG: hypothetical protein OXG36_18110 [Caldilineaceae bacterium]|nr:hypothetical protein [Caldilineaceae bacterium]
MQSMTNHRPSSIRLEASNYGPIVDAKVDLRPLTVFVGPSNTGKSYLAILVYALHRIFSGDSPSLPLMFSSHPFFYGGIFRQYIKQLDANIDILSSWRMFKDWSDQHSAPKDLTDTLVELPSNLCRHHSTPSPAYRNMERNDASRVGQVFWQGGSILACSPRPRRGSKILNCIQ